MVHAKAQRREELAYPARPALHCKLPIKLDISEMKGASRSQNHLAPLRLCAKPNRVATRGLQFLFGIAPLRGEYEKGLSAYRQQKSRPALGGAALCLRLRRKLSWLRLRLRQPKDLRLPWRRPVLLSAFRCGLRRRHRLRQPQLRGLRPFRWPGLRVQPVRLRTSGR